MTRAERRAVVGILVGVATGAAVAVAGSQRGTTVAGWRALLLAALVAAWAGRLGSFLFARIRRDGRDGRFDALKPSLPRFLRTWTLQGLWVLLTLAPSLAAMTTLQARPLDLFAAVGLAVWAIGFGIEVVADRQKREFRRHSGNRARFITTGLWAWSRHPNYFGEITLWTGVALLAAPVLGGWQYLTLVSPLFVYLLLTRVSGIPLGDAFHPSRTPVDSLETAVDVGRDDRDMDEVDRILPARKNPVATGWSAPRSLRCAGAAYDVGASPVISRIISIQSSNVRSSRSGRPSVGRNSSR